MLFSLPQGTQIANVAYHDLLTFLDDYYGKGHLKSEWQLAEGEMHLIQGRPNAVGASSFVDFIGPFVDWLEKRRRDPLDKPWEPDPRREPSLPRKSKCRVFLDSLHDTLESLIEPSQEGGMKIRSCAEEPSKMLQDYGRFVADQQGCILSYNDIPLEWERFPGFASWLIVFSNDDGGTDEAQEPVIDELHILSNTDRIKSSSAEVHTITRRFEKAFLHEIGHARMCLDSYKKLFAQNGCVISEPIEETFAWVYMYALKLNISSARARISRLLGRGDPEWK
ncbi:MAG: hypothetical protein RBR19_16835 [Sedimentisphaerales bacterium]|jgi:hypothetical protein|nr:hypothetical protein [Sedimentisphaerales bacterium]